MTDFHVVIPARYASSRFPGKPLARLDGRPMIEHVWRRALEARPASAWIATDDERIAEAVRGFGGSVVMTSDTHASGTDRLAEVAERLDWPDDAVVVNLQGDEPCMPGALVARVARALASHPEASIATLATPIRAVPDVFSPNIVKVVVDQRGFALYFSRAPIPFCREEFSRDPEHLALPEEPLHLRHLGLYAYRAEVLRQLVSSPAAAIERAESLEQLRALALGLRIHVSVEENAPLHGVDTPDDLTRLQGLLEKEG